MDAFLDDGFLIPTFEQLAALQIDYEGMVLGTYFSLRVLCLLVARWPKAVSCHSIASGSLSQTSRTSSPTDTQFLGYS